MTRDKHLGAIWENRYGSETVLSITLHNKRYRAIRTKYKLSERHPDWLIYPSVNYKKRQLDNICEKVFGSIGDPTRPYYEGDLPPWLLPTNEEILNNPETQTPFNALLRSKNHLIQRTKIKVERYPVKKF